MSMAPPPSARRHGPSASASHAMSMGTSSSGMRASPSDPTLSVAAGPSHSTLPPPPPVHEAPVTPSKLKSNAGVGTYSATKSTAAPTRPRAGHSPYPSQSSIPVPSSPARPVTPGHRVTRSVGCLSVTPNSVESRRQAWESPSAQTLKEPALPNNPTVWTPSELAQYLSYALRTGGTDRGGPTLPAPVVEDVVTWVLRSRVTGDQFMRGVDQGVARPPPFLPVLAAMSRRLRRQHGSRISDASDISATEEESSPEGSVTRVRRLAHAFDVISLASEASGDEGPSLSSLREQVAPESVHGFGRATPKTESRHWARRDSTASTMSSVSAASGFSASSSSRWRQSMESTVDDSGIRAWAKESPRASMARQLESPSAALPIKSEGKSTDNAAQDEDDVFSPPPPYGTPSAIPSPARSGLLFPPEQRSIPATPDSEHALRSGSITPLQVEHPVDSDDESPSLANHLEHMTAPKAGGVNPYAVLRRDGETRPRLPFARDSDDSSDDERPHWTTTRRVTARPSNHHAASPPAPMTPANQSSTHTPGSRRRRREREMEREVAALTGRIRELEERLAAVEAPGPEQVDGSGQPDDATKPGEATAGNDATDEPEASSPKAVVPYKKAAGLTDSDGSEPRLFEVPAVLFLTGVGVGAGFTAVAVRFLMGRTR